MAMLVLFIIGIVLIGVGAKKTMSENLEEQLSSYNYMIAGAFLILFAIFGLIFRLWRWEYRVLKSILPKGSM